MQNITAKNSTLSRCKPSSEFVQIKKEAFHLELSLGSYLDRTCNVVVKGPKTGVFGLIKCLFIVTGAAHGARSILSNTTGVIQGTTPPTSLIYFFMQITILAITSSENKKHRPQSRAQFIRVISVTGGHLQSFFHFFPHDSDGRHMMGAPPPTGAATERDTGRQGSQ